MFVSHRRGLGGRTDAAPDPETFLVSRLRCIGPGSAVEPLCSSRSAPSVREGWKPDGRRWLIGWFQVALAMPGRRHSRPRFEPGFPGRGAGRLDRRHGRLPRISLDATPVPIRAPRFFVSFSGVTGLWLCVMIYGAYLWCLTLPYYRTLGVMMSLLVLAVAFLAWSALVTGNSRRGLVTLFVIAVGLKLVHWGYYVPEWNYRHSQGPWACDSLSGCPQRWTLYTFHDWPPDLVFFTKRRVRQLRSPHYLEYQPGPESKYVLLQPSDWKTGPGPLRRSPWSRSFRINRRTERVLARTAGTLPRASDRSPKAQPETAI